MSSVSFADVVHAGLSFSKDDPAQALLLDLIDSPWVQRLRDVSQTANTRLVYMFSEHSRFGHSVGVAYLAHQLMDNLARHYPEQVRPYRLAVGAAALLHDIGHLAPGSHTAQRAWFPKLDDQHELLAVKIILSDQSLNKFLVQVDPKLPELICSILQEDQALPPWTWEIISGGGWNVDRGNWCIVDSILAGVNYGKYNIAALTDAIFLTHDQRLAFRENRLDSMLHFSVSRYAMYRQVYQHRVLLSADTLTHALVRRARDVIDNLNFADDPMLEALKAEHPSRLSLPTIFAMRESWWRYHLQRWASGNDPILADLSERLLNRNLFKTVRIGDLDNFDDLFLAAREAVAKCGFNPEYYLHEISTADVHLGDSAHAMLVELDDGRLLSLREAEPLIQTLFEATSQRRWLVMPSEAKMLLGRSR